MASSGERAPVVWTQSCTFLSEGCGTVYPANTTSGLRPGEHTHAHRHTRVSQCSPTPHAYVDGRSATQKTRRAALACPRAYLLLSTSTMLAPSVWSSSFRTKVCVLPPSSASTCVMLRHSCAVTKTTPSGHLGIIIFSQRDDGRSGGTRQEGLKGLRGLPCVDDPTRRRGRQGCGAKYCRHGGQAGIVAGVVEARSGLPTTGLCCTQQHQADSLL